MIANKPAQAQPNDQLSDLFADATIAPITNVFATFKTTKLINMQTIEQVKKGELDFRIAHRFDDIAGTQGGVTTLFGFDNVSDVRFQFDYGLTDKITLGFARSKGATGHRQLLDFNTKINLLHQKTKGLPISVSLYGMATFTPMKSSTDATSVLYFNKMQHRFTYTSQLIIARKFNSWLSLQLAPTYVHRNYVHYTDKSGLLAMGVGGRVKFTKRMGLIVDYFYTARKTTIIEGIQRYNALGAGIEIETGGHVFHLLFSNNRSLTEAQAFTENTNTWTKGQYRFGFNISRVFNIYTPKKKKKD
jgi:hypothetical protein